MTLIERLRALDRPSPIQLALAGVALVVVVVLLLILFGGKHEKRAVVDQVAIAPVTATKTEVQQAEAKDVATATEKVHLNVTRVRERSRRDVEVLHAAVAAAPPGDPDGAGHRAFFVGMCGWRVYERAADCVGYGGGSEGSRAATHP